MGEAETMLGATAAVGVHSEKLGSDIEELRGSAGVQAKYSGKPKRVCQSSKHPANYYSTQL